MAYINDENNKMHVKRIKPEISVNEAGQITWKPGLVDYNAKVFHRGKTVTNDEFNSLFLQDVYQGNYITDSLTELFNRHLQSSIYRTFTNTFNLIPSYIKYFTQPSDWGELQEDGYYYLTVPASEHGFEPDPVEQGDVERMNIDTEMYVLNSDGKFYEVAQVTTGQDNTVTAYTDDNTIMGFLVIRTNDKSYALAEGVIDATQISGLATVGLTGDYTDLINKPDSRIIALENTLMNDPIDSSTKIAIKANTANSATNATYATNLLGSGTIQNIPISTIFETGTSFVKNATNATNAQKINNLELQRVNNKLCIDDVIIPQKKLIWEGNKSDASGTYTPTSLTINLDDVPFDDTDSRYILEGSFKCGTNLPEAFSVIVQSNSYVPWAVYCDIDGYQTYGVHPVYFRLIIGISINMLSVSPLSMNESTIRWGDNTLRLKKIYKIIE